MHVPPEMSWIQLIPRTSRHERTFALVLAIDEYTPKYRMSTLGHNVALVLAIDQYTPKYHMSTLGHNVAQV